MAQDHEKISIAAPKLSQLDDLQLSLSRYLQKSKSIVFYFIKKTLSKKK